MFDINKCPKDKDGNMLAQTRDGRPVTLITTTGRGSHPLVGYIEGLNAVQTWGRDGTWDARPITSYDRDLINLPESKRSGKISIIIDDMGRPWVFDYSCVGLSVSPGVRSDIYETRIAALDIPWTEGEGMEGK